MWRLVFIILFSCLGFSATADTLHVQYPQSDSFDLKIIEQVNMLAGRMKDKSSVLLIENGGTGRAEVISNYLVRQGIPAWRIKIVAGATGDADVDIVYSPVNPKYGPVGTVFRMERGKAELLELIDNVGIGQTLALNNIQFIAGQPVITPDSKEELIRLYEIMQQNKRLKIKIEGHVCCLYERIGDTTGPGYRLSVNRAMAVYDYLVSNGIDRRRVDYEGFSSWKRVRREMSPLEEAMNRRVEIRILAK
jgi:outer membrane protein OmpA-like peptidoglycan-associated protein